MPFTPAHISAIRGNVQDRERRLWKENVNRIRELYQARKYKQCNATCEEMLKKNTTHTLHETFLHYFVAICNESLGIAAHNYSSNKLHYLIVSRDHFASALASLPLPFCSSEGSQDECPPASSSPANKLLSDHDSPAPATPPQSSENGTSLDTESDYTDLEPDFNDALPTPTTSYPITPERKAKLRQSLSVTHVLHEELIPKPLFAKKKATVDPPSAPQVHNWKPVMRKTALQTYRVDESPITPRFAKIRASFALKPNLPNKPINANHHHHNRHHLAAYLASPALTRYNTTLASFRAQLHAHVADVDMCVARTTTQQAAHRREKCGRLASLWSVREEDAVALEKRDRVERLRGQGWIGVTKQRHGWKGCEYYRELRERALRELL